MPSDIFVIFFICQSGIHACMNKFEGCTNIKFLGIKWRHIPFFMHDYRNKGIGDKLISHTQNLRAVPKLARRFVVGDVTLGNSERANQRWHKRHCGAPPISVPHPNCVAHKYTDFRHCAIYRGSNSSRSKWRDRLLALVVRGVPGCILADLNLVTMRRNPPSMSHHLILSQMNQNKAPTRANQ